MCAFDKWLHQQTTKLAGAKKAPAHVKGVQLRQFIKIARTAWNAAKKEYTKTKK
jgi:hypothetical protein